MLVGSPAYVSPEQAGCRPDVAKEADVWSFCVVLYECLTGALPFTADSYQELFRSIGEEAPVPILAHGVGDDALWEILRRGLAKSPSERWSSMHDLGQALAAWLDAHGVHDDISGVVLASKWLGRSRSEPVSPEEAAIASRPPGVMTQVAWRATEPASGQRSRWGPAVVVAFAAAAVLGFVTWPWPTGAEPAGARLDTAPAAKPPPHANAAVLLPPALRMTKPTPSAPSTTRIRTTPPRPTATAPNQPVETAPQAKPAVRSAAKPDGGIPVMRRARREPPSDLLNPY
jgi:hypothetical protein